MDSPQILDVELYPIEWIEKSLRLNELRPFEHNPRVISEGQYDRLKQSLREDGYHSRIICTQDLRIIGGHMRLRALQELGFHEVKVLVADRPLTDDQFLRINFRHNHNNGLFDEDILSSLFDADTLLNLGWREAAPFAEKPEGDKKPSKVVLCPNCGHTFPSKGNMITE